MRKKTILIIEPQVLGHHKSYLKLIVESFLLNYNVIIGTISENETLIKEDIDNKNIDVLSVNAINYRRYKLSNRVRIIFSHYVELKLYKEIYQKASKIHDIDHVFFPYIDIILLPLIISIRPFGSSMYSGISMRTWLSNLYNSQGCASGNKFKDLLFKLFLSKRKLAKIFHLEKELVNKVENCKVLYLPDPILNYRECGVLSKSNDPHPLLLNKIKVLVIGAISERKNILPLFQEVVEGNFINIELNLIGVHNVESFCKLTKSYMNILIERGQLNSVDRYVDDKIFAQEFCKCNFVWASYKNHVGSSSIFLHALAYGKPAIVNECTNSSYIAKNLDCGFVLNEEMSNLNSVLSQLNTDHVISKSVIYRIKKEHSVEEFSRILKSFL